MKCQEKSGFLIKHPCTNAPEFNCSICGKDICADHARETDEGYACISCFKEKHVTDLRSGRRGRYYNDPYFYPYYHSYQPYGFRDRFDDRDRDSFDSRGDGAEDGIEADADGS